MNRLLISGLLLSLAATPSYAQLQRHTTQHRKAILQRINGNGNIATANKTTSTVVSERLIAQSAYGLSPVLPAGTTYTWTLGDSTNYKYSGEHGSSFSYNGMAFQDDYPLNAVAFMGSGHALGLQDNYNKTQVLCDSSHFFTIRPIVYTYGLFTTVYNTFDASANITQRTELYTPLMNANRYQNTFSAGGDIQSILYSNNTTGTWDTTEFRTFGYSSGMIVHDSTNSYNGGGSWSPEYKFAYTYDGSGYATRISLFSYDISALTWYEDERYDMEYYPTHQLKKMTSNSVSGTGVLDLAYIDTFGWTSGVNYMTYNEEREYIAGSLTSTSISSKHVSAINNLPDTLYFVSYVPPIVGPSENIVVYTYDSYNQPILARGYIRSTTTSGYDSLVRRNYYFYETYTRDNTAVATVAANAGNIALYPNPATSQLFINQANATSGKEINTAKIYNITGQLIINTPCATTAGHAQVDISTLPQGTYLVLLQSTNGEMLHQEKIVKL